MQSEGNMNLDDSVQLIFARGIVTLMQEWRRTLIGHQHTPGISIWAYEHISIWAYYKHEYNQAGGSSASKCSLSIEQPVHLCVVTALVEMLIVAMHRLRGTVVWYGWQGGGGNSRCNVSVQNLKVVSKLPGGALASKQWGKSTESHHFHPRLCLRCAMSQQPGRDPWHLAPGVSIRSVTSGTKILVTFPTS